MFAINGKYIIKTTGKEEIRFNRRTLVDGVLQDVGLVNVLYVSENCGDTLEYRGERYYRSCSNLFFGKQQWKYTSYSVELINTEFIPNKERY